MILEATGEYVQDGDCIIAEVYVYDPTAEVYHPEQIRTGSASLVFGTNSIGTINFSKLHGTADGSVKVYFNHPSHTQGLQLNVQVELEDDNAYQKTVPVIISSSEDSIPLAQQPIEDSTTEYRSQRRIDENL